MNTPTRDRRTPTRERARILASRDRFWRPEDLRVSGSTRLHLLAELVEAGELRRVRRGLYWRGSSSPLGMTPPTTEALVRPLAPGPGVGPAGLYAANLLGLSTRVPRRAEIAIPARAPQGTGGVLFVARPARRARISTGLNPTEVALLETLGSWERSIELPPDEARVRLGEVMRSGAVRPARLARAGRDESARVRARLRELLRANGRSDLAEIVPEPDARSRAAAMHAVSSTA